MKPILEELTRKKDDRVRLFQEIRTQIQRIQCEISPSLQPIETPVHEKDLDLTQRKLEELQAQLQILQKEKVCHYQNRPKTVLMSLIK